MPSVVQVITDDQDKFISGDNVIFATTIPAEVPPLVTTIKPSETIVQDGGCARPQHLRSTIYSVPSTEETLKQTGVPFGIVINPFDESELRDETGSQTTMIPITASEIVRCNRCQAYMSPFMRFTDGGRRFQCAICHHVSEVSPSYFAHLDHTGQRLDKYERPELFLGSYEFKATEEYCRNKILNCRRPYIVFAFELTANSLPIVKIISKELSSVIRDSLPVDALRPGSSPPLVGFMTYNSKIQFYDVKRDGHTAHVVCDVGAVFPPVTTFLADPVQHMDKIEEFLLSLPTLVAEEELETESILGPVIEAALQTCQVDESNWYVNEQPTLINEQQSSSGVNHHQQQPPRDSSLSIPAGKVYLFHSTLPTYGQEGSTPGRLKPRWTTSPDEVRKLLGTDKEKQILSPEPSLYYNELAKKCVEFGAGVELFLFPPVIGNYLDIATLSELTRFTASGGIYKYYNEAGDRFLTDLRYSLKSSFAFEAVMKGWLSFSVILNKLINCLLNFHENSPNIDWNPSV